MSSVLAVMRPTLQLRGCLRAADVLLLLGWAVQADLYKDRQMAQSLADMSHPLQPPKNSNDDPKARPFAKVCPAG